MKPTSLIKIKSDIVFNFIKRINNRNKLNLIIAFVLFLSFNPSASAGVSIVSITREDPLPEYTGTSSVVFAILFDGPVSGIDASDFILTVNGITGASITDVSGSGETYLLTASTGSGDGTIRLDLISGYTISPSITNAPYTTGEYYTIDKTAPAPPSIDSISNDSGNKDQITNDETLIFYGIAEANSTVTINHDISGTIGTIQTDVNGNWTFDYTNTSIPAGDHSFTATARDEAGNTSSESSSIIVTVDTIASPPFILKIKDDTGISNSDEITNDPSLFFYGISEPYATVTILLTNSDSLGSVKADGNGNWNFDFSNTILYNGDYTFSATISDVAGNTSISSSDFTVTIDLITPHSPSITGISEDAGLSYSDRITNDQNVIIHGISEANSMVIINRAGVGMAGSAYTDANGNWSFDYSGTTLSDGNYSFTATAIDLAGNVSTSSASFAFTVDANIPVAPSAISITNDAGPDNTDFVTNDQFIRFNGIAEANSIITISETDTNVLGATQTDASGNWTFDYTGTALSNKHYDLTISSMDIAGNISQTDLLLVIDTISPRAIISSLSTNPDPSSATTIQIEFSEDVLLFSLNDIIVNNGIASNLNGTGPIYTVDVTPTGSDPFTIDLTAKAVIDSAGNGNMASAFQIIYGPCSLASISASPSNKTVCEGGNTNFSVMATGDNLSYQWQIDEGSGFVILSDGANYIGANSTTLTILNAVPDMNNYKYRCKVTGTCAPSAISDIAFLFVQPLPLISFSMNGSNSICSTSPEITLPSGSPVSGIYSGAGVSGNKFDPFSAGTGNHSITYTYTDNNGCTNSENIMLSVETCTDILSTTSQNDLIAIYPNPAYDILTVSCLNQDNLSIEIIGLQGKIVLSSDLSSDQSTINLNDLPSGIYFIRIWKGDELIKQERISKI